jgi:hypothetical protein
MPYDPADIVARYEAGAAAHPNGKPLGPEPRAALEATARGAGRLGAARLRDSARREWIVEARRDPGRGRTLVFRPAHGDNEPFRASADGHRPDAFLPVSATEWSVFALLAVGHDGDAGRPDEELATAAGRLADRIVREAQHRLLMGASEDEDEDG